MSMGVFHLFCFFVSVLHMNDRKGMLCSTKQKVKLRTQPMHSWMTFDTQLQIPLMTQITFPPPGNTVPSPPGRIA